MASTFSNLGLNLQATGENSGTWGAITNVNLQDIDCAIGGVITVTVTGNTTLAFTTNSSSTTYSDEAGRNKTIILSGSLTSTTITVTVPNIEKDYYIINNSGGTAVISSGGSTTVSIATGSRGIVIVDASTTSVLTALPTDQVNSPGGTTNAVQYNSAGSFAGSTNFTFDGTTAAMQTATALKLTVTSLTATNATVTGTFTGTTIVGTNLTVSGTVFGATFVATSVTSSSTVSAANFQALTNGTLSLYNTANTFYTAIKVAAGATTTATFTLPSADGTNGQALITNGSGTLSFGNAGITAGKSIALTLVFG